jgi:hypothetical protein
MEWFKRSFRENRLSWQIGLSVVMVTLTLGAFAYTIFYEKKLNELQSLRLEIDREMEAAGHPVGAVGILDSSDIQRRLDQFAITFVLFILIFCSALTLGIVSIYYLLAGRHISLLARMNRVTRHGKFSQYPQDLIPNNELGEVLLSHNQHDQMLHDPDLQKCSCSHLGKCD